MPVCLLSVAVYGIYHETGHETVQDRGRVERLGGARAVRRDPRRSGGGEDPRRPRRAAQGRGAHGGPGGASFGDADARAGIEYVHA